MRMSSSVPLISHHRSVVMTTMSVLTYFKSVTPQYDMFAPSTESLMSEPPSPPSPESVFGGPSTDLPNVDSEQRDTIEPLRLPSPFDSDLEEMSSPLDADDHAVSDHQQGALFEDELMKGSFVADDSFGVVEESC